MEENCDTQTNESTDPSLIHYKKGFTAGQKSFEEKFKDEKCVDQYEEGYKTGFKDGYKSAVTDVKEAMVKKQEETGVDPGFGIRWWP
ncbi:MAG: hypothetical protein F8N15_07870 [Methanobacterium sp.]|nr:hypothetical protein [Methanobacterium sp.]